MLKSQSVLEKMHPEDTNVFASNIIDKYENRPDDLHSLCLADFASNYISKKSDDVPVGQMMLKATLFQYLILKILTLIQI